MLRWSSLAIAAFGCGTPTRTEPATVAPPIAPVRAVDAAIAAPPLVGTSPRQTKIEAPHGGAIAALAVTPDGAAAVTSDVQGGIRLWPALDASAEPRVVDLPAPRALAIGSDPRGYLVGMLDASGGIGVAVVDRDGIVLQRAAIAGDPPYDSIAMSQHGLVALRSDQEIHQIASDGVIAARLASEAGQRIGGLAIGGGRAIAAIDSGGGKRQARWVELSPLAWGAVVPGANLVGGELSLSPSGKRLLAVVRPSPSTVAQVAVLDTTSGAVVAQDTVAGSTVALVDDSSVAILHGSLEIRDVARMQKAAKQPTQPPPALPLPPTARVRSELAIGGGRAIFAVQGELALQAPGKSAQYLGYELVTGHAASTAPGGLAFAHGGKVAQLDARLAATPLDFALPQHASVVDLRWLAGSHWLVEIVKNDGTVSIEVIDTATRRKSTVARELQSSHVLGYEPTTRLATISLGGDLDAVLRFDPAKGTMSTIAKLTRATPYERASIVPVVPAHANGAALVVVQMRERLAVRWLRDAKALDGGTPTALEGSLASVDAAGHVYVWRASNHPSHRLQAAVFRDGASVGVIPTDEVTSFWPDREGKRLVQSSQRVIALVERSSGKRVWAKPVQGVVKVLWLDDGSLAIVSLGGVARLDPATGDVLAARCGWRLALSATPKQPATPFEPLCSQLR